MNYAASCKFCNSVLKKNYFPICGVRQTAGTDPLKMRGEQPLLIYPIGNVDPDPTTLIRFVGMHPEPALAKGRHGYLRALATIELFRLNDAEARKELFAARALLIGQLFSYLERRRTSPPGPARRDADNWIRILLERTSPHTNCLSCFNALYASDLAEARLRVEDARIFLQNRSLAAKQ